MADQRTRPARNETPLERADRNFSELLQELRVTQTGVQILFAFLLTLAFTPRFPDLDSVQRATYVITLLLSVLAATLFTAPAALHRSLFQQNAKPVIVQVSSRLAAAGLIVLMPAFTGSVLLVVDVTLGRKAGITAGAGTFLVCLSLWAVLPKLVGRVSDRYGSTPTTRAPAPPSTTPQGPGTSTDTGTSPETDRDAVTSPADRLR